jgi:hypothetical protein
MMNMPEPKKKVPRRSVLREASLKSSRAKSPPAEKSSPLHWILATSLGLLFVIWLFWHFTLWYEQKVSEPTSIALHVVAGISLIWGIAKGRILQLGKGIFAQLESSRSGWLLLAVANLLAIFLILTSASIYVVLRQEAKNDQKEARTERFEIEIREQDKPLWAPVELNAEEPLFFRFYLRPPFQSQRLVLHILYPDVYKPVDKSRWIGSVRFQVPPPSGLKDYYVIRVIPGLGLYPALPSPDFPKPSLYSLTVRAGSKAYEIPDLRRRVIYLGPNKENLKLFLQQDNGAWGAELERYLRDKMGETESIGSHPLLVNPPIYQAIEITTGNRLTFELAYTSRDGLNKTRTVIKLHEVTSPGITNLFLENVPDK